jgi:hypothetical protein
MCSRPDFGGRKRHPAAQLSVRTRPSTICLRGVGRRDATPTRRDPRPRDSRRAPRIPAGSVVLGQTPEHQRDENDKSPQCERMVRDDAPRHSDDSNDSNREHRQHDKPEEPLDPRTLRLHNPQSRHRRRHVKAGTHARRVAVPLLPKPFLSPFSAEETSHSARPPLNPRLFGSPPGLLVLEH